MQQNEMFLYRLCKECIFNFHLISLLGANSNDAVHNRFKRPPLLDGPSAVNNQLAGNQQSYGAKRERNRVGQQRGRATARKTLL